MRRSTIAARVTIRLVAVVVLLASFATPAIAMPKLTIRSVETSGYPTMTMHVGVPAELGASDDTPPRFLITENGEERDLKVTGVDTLRSSFEVVLVIDTSGSMAGRPLANAKAAAERFVTSLPYGTPVSIVSFGSKPKLEQEFTTAQLRLTRVVDDLVTSGETAVYDALRMAVKLKPPAEGGGVRTVVLLSDGGDTNSVSSLDEAVRAVKRAGAPVLAVSIASPEQDQRALDILATQSGGRLIPVQDSGELTGYFGSLAEEIAGGYEVSFLSARPQTKDLEVDVSAAVGSRVATAFAAVANPQYAARAPAAGTGITVEKANPFQLLGAAFLAFVAVGLVAGMGVASVLRAPTQLAELHYYDQLHDENLQRTGHGESIAARLVEAVDSVADRHGFIGVLAPRLTRAGSALRPAEWIIFHILGVALAGFVVQWMSGNLALASLVVVMATVMPLLVLDARGGKRVREFESQLPDVLNILSGGLRTGWGIQQSLELVTSEAMPPASEEFRRVQLEARLGVPIERALSSLAERLNSQSFEWVVSAIAIQREVGGNLAEVLDQVAKSIRDRESMRRQIRSLTAEGRISAIILVILPFVVITGMILVTPAYIADALRDPAFWVMGAFGILLMAVGALWLRGISRIEY